MIPYDKLRCTGMYVHVREFYWSNTWAIRELYVALRNWLHTGEEFLNCSKNKPYKLYGNCTETMCDHYVIITWSLRPQIWNLAIYIEWILYGKLTGSVWGVYWRLRRMHGMSYVFSTGLMREYIVLRDVSARIAVRNRTGLHGRIVWLQHYWYSIRYYVLTT